MSLPPPLPFSLSLLLFLTSLLLLLTTTTTSTTISSFSISLSPWHPSQNQTLLSPNSAFAAGFHPLPTTSPTLFTFSIWYYHHNTTLIWSANQKSPVTASAALEVTPAGVLRLAGNSSGPNLWPPSSPASNSKSTQLNLSDAGELVFGEWSSFDFPTDTVVATQNTNGAASLRNGNFEFVNWTHLVFNGSDRYWSWSSWAGAFRRLEEDGKVNSSTGN